MEGDDSLAYSVATQSEVRPPEETRTSSTEPVRAQQEVTVGMPPILNSVVAIDGIPPVVLVESGTPSRNS